VILWTWRGGRCNLATCIVLHNMLYECNIIEHSSDGVCQQIWTQVYHSDNWRQLLITFKIYVDWKSVEWTPSYVLLCHNIFLDQVLLILLLFYWGTMGECRPVRQEMNNTGIMTEWIMSNITANLWTGNKNVMTCGFIGFDIAVGLHVTGLEWQVIYQNLDCSVGEKGRNGRQ